MAHYVDPVTGDEYPLSRPRWRSDVGGPLWIEPGAGLTPDDIDTGVRSMWRYRQSLPADIGRPISLGEGLTPLVDSAWESSNALFKLDFLNPTGSFKDRGSSVMLSYLRDHDITSVLEDSSGNGGSSIAAYAAAGGIKAKIFVPDSTSESKIHQVRSYGADIELVPGPREEAQKAAISEDGEAFYASHNWQAFFLQGIKTLAYELWEDLGFQAPDNVIVPVGAGSSLLGCWLGFTELLNAGSIEKMPRLFAAQPLNCSPVDAAFTGVSERHTHPTVAEGTAIAKPLRIKQILHAITDSNGGAVAVSEYRIIRALKELASRGFFVEPTSATAAAALTHLIADGTITPDETTAVLLTGSGMKAAARVQELITRSS